MKSKESKSNRGMRLHVIFAAALIGFTVFVCHSCTPPDAVYAAESDMTDPMQQMTIRGPVFLKREEAVKPDSTLEQGDITYHLVSTELKEVTKEGETAYVSASIPCELEWNQEPPESTIVTLYDEQTKSEYKRELPCLDMKETEVLWEKNFSFPITVSGYDAEQFYLGELLILKNEELVHYSDHILESMGLSKEHYRIDTITWNGEAYEKEGEIFRDALAEGEKQIRCVEVTYGGEIKTPDVTGYQYISIYKQSEKKEVVSHLKTDTEETEVEEIEVLEQKEGLAERIQRFFQEYITVVTISGLFIVFVIGMVYLWHMFKRAEKNRKARC